MPVITSTSGRLHSEFIRILFLQDHRETHRLVKVQVYRINLNLDTKAAALRINLNLSHPNLTLTPHTHKLLVY